MLNIASLFTELLAQPQKIVITTHHKPDGDAMGSSLGLYNYLIQLGHSVKVITPTDYPQYLSWMPGNDEGYYLYGKFKRSCSSYCRGKHYFLFRF